MPIIVPSTELKFSKIPVLYLKQKIIWRKRGERGLFSFSVIITS